MNFEGYILFACLSGSIAIGCTTSNAVAKRTDQTKSNLSGTSEFLPSVADVDNRGQPGDYFVEDQKLGCRNESLAQRKMAAAERALARVKSRLRTATPEALIVGLRSGRPSNDVEYIVWRDGNKLIEDELIKRGEKATDALQHHVDDIRDVWTGDGGEDERVGWLCTRVLELITGHVPGGE